MSKTASVRDCACLLDTHLAFSCRDSHFNCAWGRRQLANVLPCALFRGAWDYQYSETAGSLRPKLEREVLRRRLRRGMPFVFAALIPRVTLQKINDALELGEGETASEIYDRAKENAEPNLEMFIHVTKDGFWHRHTDLC